jgi:hypothetical protein
VQASACARALFIFLIKIFDFLFKLFFKIIFSFFYKKELFSNFPAMRYEGAGVIWGGGDICGIFEGIYIFEGIFGGDFGVNFKSQFKNLFINNKKCADL